MDKAAWINGEPKEAGWYLAASRTNDEDELYHVQQLWFNPQALDKWWSGCCWGNGNCKTAVWNLKVVAHMPMPDYIHSERITTQ